MSKEQLSSEQLRPQVWSSGGGTQSCAIAALIIQGRLPKPDYAVIADTGREKKSTWEYLRDVTGPALAKVGVTVNIAKASEFCYNGTDIFWRTGELLIPAFTTSGGNVGKLSSFCSSKWKKEVTDRWLAKQGVPPTSVQKWIGYGREEQKRWVRMMVSEDFKRGLLRLPLVHDVPMTRSQCQALIQEMGWPVPAPRSACWCCPNQADDEWLDLSKEEFAQAVELEREMQKRDPHAWLHKSCVPLDKVDFTKPPDLFNRPCDSGVCFV